jgi:hypothetical protein
MNSRTYHPFSFLLAAICLVSGLFVVMPISAAETGVRGTVLWGPVKPGPARVGKSDEAPFRETFNVFATGRQVARFKSDKNGEFEVLLPAGDYTIVPDKSTPIPAPQSQPKLVTVPDDGFAEVTLRFDTGMR